MNGKMAATTQPNSERWGNKGVRLMQVWPIHRWLIGVMLYGLVSAASADYRFGGVQVEEGGNAQGSLSADGQAQGSRGMPPPNRQQPQSWQSYDQPRPGNEARPRYNPSPWQAREPSTSSSDGGSGPQFGSFPPLPTMGNPDPAVVPTPAEPAERWQYTPADPPERPVYNEPRSNSRPPNASSAPSRQQPRQQAPSYNNPPRGGWQSAPNYPSSPQPPAAPYQPAWQGPAYYSEGPRERRKKNRGFEDMFDPNWYFDEGPFSRKNFPFFGDDDDDRNEHPYRPRYVPAPYGAYPGYSPGYQAPGAYPPPAGAYPTQPQSQPRNNLDTLSPQDLKIPE